ASASSLPQTLTTATIEAARAFREGLAASIVHGSAEVAKLAEAVLPTIQAAERLGRSKWAVALTTLAVVLGLLTTALLLHHFLTEREAAAATLRPGASAVRNESTANDSNGAAAGDAAKNKVGSGTATAETSATTELIITKVRPSMLNKMKDIIVTMMSSNYGP